MFVFLGKAVDNTTIMVVLLVLLVLFAKLKIWLKGKKESDEVTVGK